MKEAADNLVEVRFTRQEAEALLKIAVQQELKGLAKRAVRRIKDALPGSGTASRISDGVEKSNSGLVERS